MTSKWAKSLILLSTILAFSTAEAETSVQLGKEYVVSGPLIVPATVSSCQLTSTSDVTTQIVFGPRSADGGYVPCGPTLAPKGKLTFYASEARDYITQRGGDINEYSYGFEVSVHDKNNPNGPTPTVTMTCN